ncbi:MAG: stressosome-associated protein Prli42 [Tenericutes bacterium]|nr:stressosome-associated protein Prli42 [Mycoplasmatota bacterium]
MSKKFQKVVVIVMLAALLLGSLATVLFYLI